MGQVALLIIVTRSVVLRCSSLAIGRISENLCMPVARFPRRTTLGYSVDSAAGRRALDPPARHPDQDGDDEAAGIASRHDQLPQDTGDQPYHDPRDDAQVTALLP